MMRIAETSEAISTQDPSRQSNPEQCLGTILKLQGAAYDQAKIDNIDNISNIRVGTHTIDAALKFF